MLIYRREPAPSSPTHTKGRVEVVVKHTQKGNFSAETYAGPVGVEQG